MLHAFSTTIHVPNIATGEQLLEALEVKMSPWVTYCSLLVRKELKLEILRRGMQLLYLVFGFSVEHKTVGVLPPDGLGIRRRVQVTVQLLVFPFLGVDST